MSARSAGQAFDLRCDVHEQLVDFLQKHHPEALPRQRSEVAVSDIPYAKAAKASAVREAAGGVQR